MTAFCHHGLGRRVQADVALKHSAGIVARRVLGATIGSGGMVSAVSSLGVGGHGAKPNHRSRCAVADTFHWRVVPTAVPGAGLRSTVPQSHEVSSVVLLVAFLLSSPSLV
eukprot:m.13767 g.13767  ORF g.13767 m.13767 type:complete len:110 (-) comp4651_c1_seq1:26-355(-)